MSEPKDSNLDDLAEGGKADEAIDVEALKRSIIKLKRKVEDQQDRIEALARGREEGMNTVGELRAELTLVQAERDRLRKELTQLEGMQTETQAFTEDEIEDDTDAHQGELPSIDELMASFSGDDDSTIQASHSTLSVETQSAEGDDYQEMISPELLVLGSKPGRKQRTDDRYLVLLDGSRNRKCPLDQDLLTIGRSESADIQVDKAFVSRIHARVLRIGADSVLEDGGSKNGTWVNGNQIDRHVLEHGDLVRIGSANFRFVDTSASQEKPE